MVTTFMYQSGWYLHTGPTGTDLKSEIPRLAEFWVKTRKGFTVRLLLNTAVGRQGAFTSLATL